MSAAVEDRHPGAALADLLAGLDAGWNADFVMLAIEAGHIDHAAERRRGEAHRAFGEQRRPFPLEERMAGDRDEDVEVARRSAARTGFAFAGQADAGALVHAPRHADLERIVPSTAPRPPTCAAGTGKHAPHTPATGASIPGRGEW